MPYRGDPNFANVTRVSKACHAAGLCAFEVDKDKVVKLNADQFQAPGKLEKVLHLWVTQRNERGLQLAARAGR